MGCTVGQAITGVSTLAVGSIITFIAIVFGSALTMKIQYYKMVYMRLLPSGMRKLDAV